MELLSCSVKLDHAVVNSVNRDKLDSFTFSDFHFVPLILALKSEAYPPFCEGFSNAFL